MKQDEFVQRFKADSRRQVAARFLGRGVVCYLGGLLLFGSFIDTAPTVAASSLARFAPRGNEQGSRLQDKTGRPSFLLAEPMMRFSGESPTREAIPTLTPSDVPPATLPPAIWPTNQFPGVNVPPLEPIPDQTPTLTTPTQPERQSTDSPPGLDSSPIIEFGQPLPKLR